MRFILIGLSIVLSGCSFVDVIEQPSGAYEISAVGTIFHSGNALMEKIKANADEVCGVDNYTIKIGEFGSSNQEVYTNGTTVNAPSNYLITEVKCNS